MTSRMTSTGAQSAQPMQQQQQQQTTTEVVPEERRCQYSSKRCENPRTYKKSGQLHTFCSYHREKANRNQMRVDRRRRRQRSPTASVTPTGNAAAAGMGLAAPRARAAHRTVKPAMVTSWGVHPSSIKLEPPLAIRINHNADPATFMLTDEDVLMFEQMAASPTSASYMPPAVAPSPTGPALFNDEDLFILQSLLFSDEESQSPDDAPYHPQQASAWCASGRV